MPKPAGSTPATTMLTRLAVPFTEHAYDHDATAVAEGLGYGAEAAAALRVEPDQVFKTLLVEVDGAPAVVIVPVLEQVQLKAAASALGGKRATMLDPAVAQRVTGYVVGGISPLGQKKQLPTAIDETAWLFDTVYVSGGRRGFDIELAPDDLRRVLVAVIADLTR